jgi:phage terminase large subunit-like protein
MSSQELIVTDGNASDFAEIEAQLAKLVEHFDVQMIVFDPWQGENSRQKFAAMGYETSIWQANNRGEWTIAMDDFEADLKNGKLVHSDNAVLNWCAANICAHHRGVTRVPVKPAPNSEQKIDAMVAALMAFAASNIVPAIVAAPTIEWFD